MPDVPDLRERMVDRLVREVAVRSAVVERALRSVPRHRFVPQVDPEVAYADDAVVTRTDRTGQPTSSVSQPAMVAVMLDQLGVAPGDRVLEIGAGAGYNAALLAQMCGPVGQVTTVELDGDLAEEARARLGEDGYPVEVVAGDGWQGHPDGAPYDRIIVTVGAWDLAPAWLDQLDELGLLVVPLWLRAGVQVSVALRRDREGLSSMSLHPCGFVRLRGEGAGPEASVSGDGWSTLLDEPDPTVRDDLDRLLGKPGPVQPLRGLADGWFVAQALQSPHAVQLLLDDPERGQVVAQGLLDPQREGLALVVDEELRSYGAPEVAEYLREVVAETEPVPLGELRLDVRRADAEVAADADVLAVLHRPSVTIVVRRRKPASG